MMLPFATARRSAAGAVEGAPSRTNARFRVIPWIYAKGEPDSGEEGVEETGSVLGRLGSRLGDFQPHALDTTHPSGNPYPLTCRDSC
jgi:hypothetical protein